MTSYVLPAYFHAHTKPGFFYSLVRLISLQLGCPAPFSKNATLLNAESQIEHNKYIIFLPALMFCGGRWSPEDNPIYSLSDCAVRDINSSKAVVIVDHSQESGSQQHMDLIEKLCVEKKIYNLRNIIHISQNRLLDSIHHSIQHFSADYHIIRAAYYIINNILSEENDRNLDIAMTNRLKDKSVLCLNATPKAHRLLACAALHHYDLLDNSLVSFPGTTYAKGLPLDVQALMRKLGALKYLRSSIRHVIEISPLIVDSFTETGNSLAHKIDIAPYQRTWISLVTETAVGKGAERITEKTFKSMALGHPYISYNGMNTIKTIKELGFGVYSDVISGEYDTIDNSYVRLEYIIDEIRKFLYIIESGDVNKFNYIVSESRSNRDWLRGGFIGFYQDRFISPIIKYIGERLS